MERIVIIDHNEHILIVEDIDEDVLNEKYDGEEEKYIEAHYDVENYSWDYIVGCMYIKNQPPFDDPIRVDFERYDSEEENHYDAENYSWDCNLE